ncbi:hypothetical protein IQ06DRAFT_93881 [Phaeosphaeriaceae sp. SRC1lsM3a]|nr:hypothetical protein IQ06DRAFT_93881 [Stagonospora sp. SRC1lsM3a]
MNSPNVDLFTLFQIWNPRYRYHSCVGYAPTRRQRCGWEMDSTSVTKQLKDIGDKLPHAHPTKAELMRVATDALCHHHKRQSSDIATKWKIIIDDIDLEDLSERMRNARMNDDDPKPRFGGSQSSREETKRKQEERERQERAQEEARKKREEEERKSREERAKEYARKEQERKDREAEGERRSWRQAWTRYVEAQRKFKEKKVCSSLGMPWPVRSGLSKDVNEQSVVAFYYNALPGSSANESYKIMQQECLMWHPDKVKQFIASLTLTAAEEANMAVVARMVIELHKEFRERRAP